jgi:hypothetical protein
LLEVGRGGGETGRRKGEEQEGKMSETSITKAARGWPVVGNSIARTEFFYSEEGGRFVMATEVERLESELAAMTAERDALKELDAIASSIEWCMRLSESVKEGETMVQWVKRMFDATARAELAEKDWSEMALLAGKYKKQCAELIAAKELAERQVAVLCGRIDDYGSCWNCPAKVLGAACSHSGESCRDALAAWSRAEAEKGGNG